MNRPNLRSRTRPGTCLKSPRRVHAASRSWLVPIVGYAAAFVVGSLLLARPAWAVIQVLIPLQSLINDSDYIFVARVEKVDPARPSAVLTVGESLKGKAPFERLPVNLTGDKEKHTPQLLKRIAADVPIIVCVRKDGANKYMALAFTNGTWFQMLGQKDADQTRWSFTHCEIYLRRTFKGTTDELQQTITDVLAGKRKAPPPLPKEPAGFGPELPAQ